MIRHSTHLPSASPLASSRLDVTIDDLIAHYELRHRFRNDRAEPIEIVYSFPLPLDAAFLGMEATLAGDTRVARVQPRHSAREAFDDAIAEGDSAVLLERLEPGLLCVDLGNLKPGEDGEIVLRFTAALAVADGIARFSLPLVHRPRYGRSRLDELATPTYDFAVEHPLDATIRVTGRLADTPVQCASHAVRFAREGDALRLTLGGALLDRDLVLNFDLPENLASLRLVADEAGAIGLVDLTAPRQQHADAPMDVCLVLDDSGSMIGDAVAQSRNALTAMADALGDEDRVQVLRFGSSVVPLFRRPLRATQRVRDAMHALARTVGANLGGTEMSEALSAALDALTDADSVRSRAIILVTDGAVQPHELTAARDAAMARGIRIFVVAVGSSAGADVLEPLARATGAVLERAVPAEPIDAAVLRQFRRARCIAPLEIQLNWGDGARPLPPSPIYPGDAATLVAFLPDAAPRRVQVRIGPAETASVLSCDHATTDPAGPVSRPMPTPRATPQSARPSRCATASSQRRPRQFWSRCAQTATGSRACRPSSRWHTCCRMACWPLPYRHRCRQWRRRWIPVWPTAKCSHHRDRAFSTYRASSGRPPILRRRRRRRRSSRTTRMSAYWRMHSTRCHPTTRCRLLAVRRPGSNCGARWRHSCSARARHVSRRMPCSPRSTRRCATTSRRGWHRKASCWTMRRPPRTCCSIWQTMASARR